MESSIEFDIANVMRKTAGLRSPRRYPLIGDIVEVTTNDFSHDKDNGTARLGICIDYRKGWCCVSVFDENGNVSDALDFIINEKRHGPSKAIWRIRDDLRDDIWGTMMTTGEKIEANADLIVWCVHVLGHVLGADDVLAAPSHDAAVVHAHKLNESVFGRVSTPDDVLCFAYAAPWPHSRESHAEDLKNWLKDR